MSDLIIVQKDGATIYSNDDNFPVPSSYLTLDGAKAHSLRCSCGGKVLGLSGWVGTTLKMRLLCDDCRKDFFIERETNKSDYNKYYCQQEAQINIEREFLTTYRGFSLEEPKKQSAKVLPFKKQKIIELTKSSIIEDDPITKKAIEYKKEDESL